MARTHLLSSILTVAAFAPAVLLAEEISDDSSNEIVYNDPLNIFYRKRNAHACMMSIVFLVLYPLGAISLHLPLPKFLRKIPIVTSVHVPIQILGLAMMIGALGLGIDIAGDLHFFSHKHVKAHVIIGLLATSMIIVIQPVMGILQHLHFRKTGEKSIFAYIHRWNGRIAVILGMINQGLGFQLVGIGTGVHVHSLVGNFVALGVFGSIWLALAGWDWLRGGLEKRKTISVKAEEKKSGENGVLC